MPLGRKTILKKLEKVMDPELGVPITEMELVDKIEIKDGEVTVDFHLTAPYCPPMLALKYEKGKENVMLNMTGHYLSTELNKEVNK